MSQKIIFDYDAVLKLKRAVAKQFSAKVHFHDGCGGQYFSLDEVNNELKKYIIQYYFERNMQAVFSKDGLQFTVEKG